MHASYSILSEKLKDYIKILVGRALFKFLIKTSFWYNLKNRWAYWNCNAVFWSLLDNLL